MGVGADTGTTKGVLGDARTAGDRERRGVTDGSARVPEDRYGFDFFFIRKTPLLARNRLDADDVTEFDSGLVKLSCPLGFLGLRPEE